ncbi:hypothetical protein PSU4_07750 [Pseudonocardia sulfidoxydans NBRC 16205]|uniref:Uncharacterized protein n=1 Tax=Pseudonocardia sulfidoxydans NBRC 16205 TaxID=1223511 RepID=A0A511DAL6_9PSEU|nr:hypothetical protein PSU4_07750 [Pseudonocardia sulfidoxydans NBRC 16205]
MGRVGAGQEGGADAGGVGRVGPAPGDDVVRAKQRVLARGQEADAVEQCQSGPARSRVERPSASHRCGTRAPTRPAGANTVIGSSPAGPPPPRAPAGYRNVPVASTNGCAIALAGR